MHITAVCVCDATQPSSTTEANHFHDDWQGHDMTDSNVQQKKILLMLSQDEDFP